MLNLTDGTYLGRSSETHTPSSHAVHTYFDAKSSLAALCTQTSGLVRREQLAPASSSHHHRMRPEATGTYVEQHGHIFPLRHDLTQLALTPLSLIMFLCVYVCVESPGLCDIILCMTGVKEVPPKRFFRQNMS